LTFSRNNDFQIIIKRKYAQACGQQREIKKVITGEANQPQSLYYARFLSRKQPNQRATLPDKAFLFYKPCFDIAAQPPAEQAKRH
jgi:hypothetical protein